MSFTPPFSVSSARILIVDDCETTVVGLTRLLQNGGYELCIGMTDPEKAVAEFPSLDPDLILLDWHMEKVGGTKVLEEVAASRARTPLPPVIVLTADCSPETRQEALFAGASDFLTKPFDHSEVLLRIRNILRLRFFHRHVESENQRLEELVRSRTVELRQTIADLRALQHQVVEQDRMRALAAMAGGIAHDFNNSLMVIRGYSELYGEQAEREFTGEEINSAFSMIALAARDASEIVRRLRTFYRPFNDGGEEQSRLDLKVLIEESVALTQPKWETQARAAGILIMVRLELEDGLKIVGVPAEMREVMINLIFNAVDAMPQGGQILIRSRAEGERLVVEIGDTGTGMTEETKQRCLEPFYTTKGQRGTGLGLSIIYGIMHRHGGSIQLRSELNHGTCMTLTFPRSSGEATVEIPSLFPVTRNLRILVVDDDPQICSIVSRFLECDEHDVSVAGNGCEALEKLNHSQFDLIITDRVMPKMSGDQLASEIRLLNPRAAIILLTGFETHRVPQAVDILVSKPVTQDALRRAIGEIMRLKGPLAAA